MTTRPRLASILVLGIVAALSISCAAPQPTPTPSADWPTEGWRTSTPEKQGMDSGQLADMLAQIEEHNHRIDSVLVVRQGYLLLEAYVSPFQPGEKHIVYSCTKSVVSALVGIAMEQGYLEGVDQPVLDIVERSAANLDPRKRDMTLEDLLTMSTGLDCRDSYLYRWEGLSQMRRSDDWVQFVLDLPMAAEPGTRFEYCNGASFLLSANVQEKTGQSALDFARAHLFGPLGISDVEWASSPQGITIGWSDLHLTPRDMAKIGYLYLRGGQWDGKQVVPAGWVEASTRKHISATLEDGYGYQWWVDDSGYYMALGYAGQFIFVVPEKDLVVVFVSDLAEQDFYVPQQLLEQHILPAAKSNKPLPPDSGKQAELERQVERLGGQ
jgi:CubicO group peptidase (beta-lactamase class C family)